MTHFEVELQSLRERLLAMASRAEASVARAMDALIARDDDAARRVREEDDAIDQLEKAIDEEAIRLLSRRRWRPSCGSSSRRPRLPATWSGWETRPPPLPGAPLN